MNDEVIILIGAVWSILCIALFCKVWGMTNDVKEIKKHLTGK